MSDLTDRIAKVICSMDALHAQEWAQDVAAAIVKELGLRDEWGILDHEYSGLLADTREELDTRYIHHSEQIMHRYITEWTPDA